jgi:hypothetical protein
MPRQQPISFSAEVRQHFQFLVDSYGSTEPDYSEILVPGVRYGCPGLTIWVFLQSGDGAGTSIDVQVTLPNRDWPAKAELSDLVEAAQFAPRHRVARKAHTPEAVRATLEDTATWLRRLMPLLVDPGVDTIIRKANERPVDSAGNPKRRRPNIPWKFP